MIFQFLLLVFISPRDKCFATIPNALKPSDNLVFSNKDCPNANIVFAPKKDEADIDYYSEIPSNFFKDSIIKSVSFTADITTIGSSAFEKTTVTDAINLAGATKLETISSKAFYDARINSITFPASLKTIQGSAFELCRVSSTLNFASSNLLTAIFYEKVFKDAVISTFSWPPNLVSLYTPSSPVKSEYEKCTFYQCKIGTLNLQTGTGLETIPGYAFYGTIILTKITFPEELKEINSCAFSFADITSKIEITKNVDTIQGYAFDNCKIHGQLDFTQSIELEKIESNAFSEAQIESIIFPPNIQFIKPSAFKGATISSTLTFPAKLEKIEASAFESGKGFTTLDFSKATALKEIGTSAFKGTEVSSPVNFPAKLEKIGATAFSGDNKDDITPLSTITFNSDLKEIGSKAFVNIITLTQMNNLKVKDLSSSAFSGCRNMVASTIIILSSGKIDESAFFDCYNLASDVTIQDATELNSDKELIYSKVGANAFQNSGIKTISFPPYLEKIDTSAFENCTSLTGSGSISCETIAENAFYDDNQVVFSTINATSILASAFENCHKLNAAITIYYYGNIAQKAFKNCYSLKGLEFLFDEEDGIATKDKQEIKDKINTIGLEAFYRSGLTGSLTIPITINDIGKEAFAHCSKLTSLTIDECDDKDFLLTINEKAFYRSNLGGKLVLPYNTKIVDEYAFAYCPLTALEVRGTGLIEDGTTELKDFAFYACKISALTFLNEDVSFTTKTFRGCPLNNLQLGNLETIPEEAFYGMTSITSTVTIPKSVKEIEARAFAGCSKMPKVTFEDASICDTIGIGAFYGCSNLGSINIPFPVTKIDEYTFYKCENLGSINIGELVKSIEQFAFYGCSGLTSSLTFPIELTTIGISAFEGCENLQGSLEFPDSVTTVNKQAFKGCKSLNGHVTFGRSIETIGESAFRDCSGFTGGLTFPEYLFNTGALTISKCAFYGCSGFTGDLILPKGTTLDEDCFRGCSGFKGKLILQDDITSIPKGAFRDCSGFTGEIPTKLLTSIDDHAFHGCSGFTGPLDLSSFTGTEININEYAFCDCSGLDGALILPAPLKEVKQYAFNGCSRLTGTLDCSEFTHIHRYAFAGCSSLTGTLEFEDSLSNVDQYAFRGCSGFSDKLTFRIGSSKLDIDQCAFQDCSGFKNGKLSFMIKDNEEELTSGGVGTSSRFAPYYRYDYFLKIGNDAFDGTKFKNIYYLGRFEPDCDYDIGISQIKGIHTSSNYANKTFCNYPLHKSKLSGGAIAGIVIACVVVVAAIVILIVFLIMRAKKNKDNSEGEVEMNNEP